MYEWLKTLKAKADRLKGSDSGIAATEFALIAPFMIALYMGAVDLSQGITLDRKVSHASSALSDLVTQQVALDSNQMNDIMDAAQSIVAPWPADAMAITITGVQMDADGSPEVSWSVARGGSVESGTLERVPEALRIPNTFLVTAVLSYNYTPPAGKVLTGTMTLSDEFFLRPRRSDTITYSP